jgi:hypothetical protein
MSEVTVSAPNARLPQRSTSPLSLLGWRDLFLKPSRFFARGPQLTKRPEALFVGWTAGISYCINRIDTNVIKAQLGVGRSDQVAAALTESWLAFWFFVLLAAFPSGWIIWHLAGWWYRKRLEWSGAVRPHRELARSVYAYQNLVQAVPGIILVLIYTAVFRNYGEAWNSDEMWSSFVLVFVIWSCFTSYFAALTVFHTSRGRAALWFLALPIVLYTFAFGVIGIIFTLFSDQPAA